MPRPLPLRVRPVVASWLAAAFVAAAAAAAPPNVVVIFVDDLGYGDIGPFGAKQQATPHLDRMAAEGMKLTNFYAAPVCSVSRAQLLTGCYGLRVGVPSVWYPADQHGLNPDEITIAERLKPLGYATACVGKWHLGDQPEFLPTRQGFDHYYGIPYSNDMQRVSAETGERVVPLLRDEKVEALLTDEMQTSIVEKSTAEAVRFIEGSKDGPFFLYMPHTAVHVPIKPGARFSGTSGNGPFGDWVQELDWSVGQVLDTLRRLRLDEKTLVIFTSDNGPWAGAVGAATSAGPLRGSKGSTWEGGVRVPTIAWWPGHVAAGCSCATMAGTIDLLPTVVRLAGGTVPAEPVIDGRDIAPVLLGTAEQSPRDAHYFFLGNELQAVRKGPWKLAVATQAAGMGAKKAGPPEPASLDRPRLYHLDDDLGETSDVAAGHPEVVAELKALAEAMTAELVDPKSSARRPAGSVAAPRMLYPTRSAPDGKNAKRAAAPPNVVVILADDLGFSDLGCYGGEIDTPHLDRLASGGLQFTQGYNTARCWPTRGALLTGYYAQSIHRDSSPGIEGGNAGHHRPAWARLLPELLAPAGYRSYHSGKWHIDGDPRQQGFARSLQIEGGQNDYFDPAGITVDGQPIEAADGFYVTTAVGDHAAECLREHAAAHAGVPFFSYIAFTSPHFPLHAPQEVVAKYKARYQAGWDALREARYRRLVDRGIIDASLALLEPEVGPPYQPKPDVLARFGPGEIDRPRPWASLSPEQQAFQATKMAIHAAMVEMMDRAVGKIVGQLEAMHALDDTLILFLSDNGASAEIGIRGKGHDPSLPPGASGTFCCLGPGFSSCANTPFRRHKTWVHEGGIATPWIVHWPKGFSSRSALRTQPVHVVDVVPTVLQLAGIVAPGVHDGRPVPPLQGKSFVACLADPSATPPHDTLWWCHGGHRAVRVGNWKLVAVKNQPWELYDLARDRTETANVATSEPARVAALEKAWNTINEQCRHLAELVGQRAATPQSAPARP